MKARAAAGAVGTAALDAALAGAVVGVADLALIATRAPLTAGALPATIAIVLGLAVLAVTVIGTPIVLIVRALGAHPVVRPLAARLREPGARRVEALTALAVGVVALALIWYVGYRIVAFGHRHYRFAGGAGLLASTEILVLTVVVAIAATAGGPGLARLLGRRPLLHRVTTGRLALAIGTGLAIVGFVVLDRVLGAVAPAFDAPPAYVLALTPLALLAVAVTAPGRRLPRRAAAIVGGAGAVLALGAVLAVGRADRARGSLIGYGTVSQATLRELYALSDDDGDGYSDRFGGGDCDDDDRAVHPGGPELADNGKDDNCVGGDATAASLTRRRSAHPSATPGAPRHDVILVTIDSVRADHTSAYGYARATTPVLAALAARGARFLRAESPAPLTRWAVPALLFGRYTSTLPYRDGAGNPQLREHRLPTVASTLRDAGYLTHAILSNEGILVAAALVGFDKVEGISKVPVPEHTDNAEEVTDRALAWLAKQPADQPCFLWIHYIDPHYPYEPPEAAPRFGDRDSYDREIAFTDAQLGRLVDGVRTSRGDGVILAVTADHGEAFGEHGTRFHGKSLYEELTHVPLVIVVPGAAPRVIPGAVSLVDVGPTLLDLVGVTAPAGMNGWSLAAAIHGGPIPDHDVLGELFRGGKVPRNLVALFRGDLTVIRDLDSSTLELYDVAKDPQQLDDRGDSALAIELGRALDAAADRELGALPEEAGTLPP